MTYAERYGAGPMVRPGSLTLAVGATVLPIAVLLAGLQVAHVLTPKPTKTTIFDVKDPPPPPPDPVKKVQPKTPDQKVYIPTTVTPPLLNTPPIETTLTKPADPPLLNNVGTAPEPLPPAAPPIKPPVIVAAQIASMGSLQPPYPADMIRAQQEGRVVVRVLIGADGRVKQVEKISASNDSFFAATERQAMGRWRFKPATKDGVPFDQWKEMSLRFQLDGEQ